LLHICILSWKCAMLSFRCTMCTRIHACMITKDRFVDPDCYYPSCIRVDATWRNLIGSIVIIRAVNLWRTIRKITAVTRFNAPLSRPEPGFPRICSLESPLWGWLPTWSDWWKYVESWSHRGPDTKFRLIRMTGWRTSILRSFKLVWAETVIRSRIILIF